MMSKILIILILINYIIDDIGVHVYHDKTSGEH